MRNLACAGAMALAIVGGICAAVPATGICAEQIEPTRASGALSEGDIARIKDTLKLTPAQERLWAPFAAALRDVARKLAQGDGESSGYAQKASAMAGSATRYRRLALAAAPLIRTFDETQRRDAMMMARAFGFEHLAAAF